MEGKPIRLYCFLLPKDNFLECVIINLKISLLPQKLLFTSSCPLLNLICIWDVFIYCTICWKEVRWTQTLHPPNSGNKHFSPSVLMSPCPYWQFKQHQEILSSTSGDPSFPDLKWEGEGGKIFLCCSWWKDIKNSSRNSCLRPVIICHLCNNLCWFTSHSRTSHWGACNLLHYSSQGAEISHRQPPSLTGHFILV